MMAGQWCSHCQCSILKRRRCIFIEGHALIIDGVDARVKNRAFIRKHMRPHASANDFGSRVHSRDITRHRWLGIIMNSTRHWWILPGLLFRALNEDLGTRFFLSLKLALLFCCKLLQALTRLLPFKTWFTGNERNANETEKTAKRVIDVSRHGWSNAARYSQKREGTET